MTTPVGEEIASRAMAVMRLAGDDVDADRIGELARVARGLIDTRLDRSDLTGRPDDELPSPVLEAAVTVTRELYSRKDAPFGITNSYGPDGGAIRLSRDPLAGVEHLLAPYVGGWGFA